ncbi:MAG: MATE family efflux transporter [Clostridia bacterium]|nr:MATE family efflux transporter [Clostridia bacterium]
MASYVRAKKEVDMLNGPLLGRLIRFSIPLILSGILQLLYNAADIIIVGQFEGVNAVGAVGATTSLNALFTNLAISISAGTSMCLSAQLGAKNRRAAFEYVHTAIITALVLGVGIGSIGFFLSRTMLVWTNTDAAILSDATLYLKICFCGMPANLLYNYAAAIIRNNGDTKSPLIYLSISGLLNVGLNILLVAAFHMGVAGVAVATVSSQALSALLCLFHLHRLPKEHPCHLFFNKIRFYNNKFIQMLKAGIPIALNGLAFSIANVTIYSNVNAFGVAATAGSAASSSVEGFTYIAMNAVGQATLIFVGQNRGAENWERVKRVVSISSILVVITGVVMAVVTFLFREPLLLAYLGEEGDALSFGVSRMICVLLPYFLCGLMEVFVSGSRGMGYSFWPMVITVSSVFGFRMLWIALALPPLYALIPDPFAQFRLLFLAFPISWLIACLPQCLYFSFVYRRTKKALSKELAEQKSSLSNF